MFLKVLHHAVTVAQFLDIHIFEQEQMGTVKLNLYHLNVSDGWDVS